MESGELLADLDGEWVRILAATTGGSLSLKEQRRNYVHTRARMNASREYKRLHLVVGDKWVGVAGEVDEPVEVQLQLQCELDRVERRLFGVGLECSQMDTSVSFLARISRPKRDGWIDWGPARR